MLGTALVEGSRTVVWPRGGQAIKQDVLLWVTAWQGIGGQLAMTIGAARYLLKQLEELASTAELQPVYIQWTNSAAAGAFSRVDEHDGWYTIDAVAPDYTKFIGAGIVECRMSVSFVAAATPSSLSLRFLGGALSSTYTTPPVPLLAFPLGSGGNNLVPIQLSRTGGEGSIPCTVLATAGQTANPVPFVRPASIANLYAGGIRMFDVGTANLSGNPVPVASGVFKNANWFQVYGTQHDLAGDSLILTNGLLLLVFQLGIAVGASVVTTVYLWNTSLVTPTWQQMGTITYQDGSGTAGQLTEINVLRVYPNEGQVRVRLTTTNGNYADFRVVLGAGQYGAAIDFMPLTQANSVANGLAWVLTAAAKIVYNEAAAADAPVSGPVGLATSTKLGFAAAFGTTANGPLVGIGYPNAPSSAQCQVASATSLQFGDTNGPAQNSYRTYFFWAVPFVTAPNLQAEGESGTLGTGWSSVADAAASGGNTAKVASGTLTGNADLFGTSYVPTAGQYDVWFRVKVTSAAGSAAELTLGLWDTTSAAFVANGSTTFKANQASTSYVWLKANSTSPFVPTAAHNMQFRAVTAATLGTDWFIDEAALVPIQVVAPPNGAGIGNFPGDIWAQLMFDCDKRWVRG